MFRYNGVVCQCTGDTCDCQASILRQYVEDIGQFFSGHSYMAPSSFGIMKNCPAAMQRKFIMNARKSFVSDNLKYINKGSEKESLIDVLFHKDEAPANDGTIFHEVFETAMLLQIDDDNTLVRLIYDPSLLCDPEFDTGKSKKKWEIDFLNTVKMSDATLEDSAVLDIFITIVKKYVDILQTSDWYACEMKLELSGFDTYGTVDLIFKKNGVYHIFDLKTGRLEVHAENNQQIQGYTHGLIQALGGLRSTAKLQIGIIPIRFPETTWDITVADIEKYWDELSEALYKAHEFNPKAIVGSHCMNCDVKMNCAEWMNFANIEVNRLCVSNFDDVGENFVNSDTKDLVTDFLTLKAIDKTIGDMKSELEMRFAGFDEDVDNRLKLVNPAPMMKIKDESEAVKLIRTKLKGEASKNALVIKPRPPKEIQKFLTEEDFNSIVDLVPKRPYIRMN